MEMLWNGFVFFELSTQTCFDTNGNIINDHATIKQARCDWMYGRSKWVKTEF